MKYTSEKSYSVNTANLIIVFCLLCYSKLMNFRYRCNVYLRSNPEFRPYCFGFMYGHMFSGMFWQAAMLIV